MRLRVILGSSLLICPALAVAWAGCAFGEDDAQAPKPSPVEVSDRLLHAQSTGFGSFAVGSESPRSTLLKLQVTHAVFEYPEGDRNYKRPQQVDASLVKQIDTVRTSLPSLRELPHLAPGVGFKSSP